ncbi:MAG: hypothetical protein J7485_02635 [Sphingobium sp.]|nr:hypothetical protein [Sphingobium sp.]
MRFWAVKAMAIGAGCAGIAIALSPAISAVIRGAPTFQTTKVSLKMLGSIGSFTPVTRDQDLAKAYADAARESMKSRGFRFTPASGTMAGERALTVLVRATSDDSILAKRAQPASNIGVAPVAYSLGKSKGLEHFIDDGLVPGKAKELSPLVDSLQMPGSNFKLPKANPDRFSANIQLEARDQTMTAPTNETPQTLGQEKTYSVDVNGSVSVTRNLAVQAGVRYKGPDNRLSSTLTDQAKDSQAVYVGTKFKF